jgi:hypothetical protein
MKYLFIDIRKSDEVYAKHFAKSKEYSFYNIPMEMIRFNAETIIEHLKYIDEIYIVCKTGSMSQFIKNKYFDNYDRIKVSKNLQFSNLKHGSNDVFLNEKNVVRINIIGSKSFNFYNVMRIIQTLLGTIMVASGGYTIMQLKKENLSERINIIPLIILIVFGIMAIYNGLTSTCSISMLFKNYLN